MPSPRRSGRLRRRSEALGQHWARRRQGIDCLPVTLKARRLYILPTGTGLAAAVLLLAILAAGLNYGNGLVMLLCFLFTGFTLAGLHQCHRRLLGLVIQDLQLEPGFAGGHLVLRLQLASAPGLAAGEYRLSLRTAEGELTRALGEGDATMPRFTLRPAVTRRGEWVLPPLRLDCEAPVGLFHCWTWLHLEATTLVYPRPDGARPLPGAPEGSGEAAAGTAGHDEWVGLRPFREGDSPRQIAWKAYARGTELLSREWQGSEGLGHALDFGGLQGLDTEARLSQLAAWILEAERRQESWSLELPGRRLPPGLGADPAREGLSALARHGLPAGSPP